MFLPPRSRALDSASNRIVKFKELSNYMDVPLKTLYLLAANRDATGFPAFRVGREWRASIDEVLQWLLECHARGAEFSVSPTRRDAPAPRKPTGRLSLAACLSAFGRIFV